MFTEHELEEFKPLFEGLNINNEDQMSILELFYALGTLVYHSQI